MSVHITPSRRDRWQALDERVSVRVNSADDFGVIHWRSCGVEGVCRFEPDELLRNLGRWVTTDGPLEVKAESADLSGVIWVKAI